MELQGPSPITRAAQPKGASRWIPALGVPCALISAGWLPKDLVAGLVLTAILVPVGMGYAEAAGLPTIYGLYATIFPLVRGSAIFRPWPPPRLGARLFARRDHCGDHRPPGCGR